MGYALFTARKFALTSRINLMNAQLMSNSERANALTAQTSAKQTASAFKQSQAQLNAYDQYKKDTTDVDSSTEEGQSKIAEAERKLNTALGQINATATMTDQEINLMSQQQNALDMARKTLETQLQAYTKELEAVEKAEEEAIKNSTPKFGA